MTDTNDTQAAQEQKSEPTKKGSGSAVFTLLVGAIALVAILSQCHKEPEKQPVVQSTPTPTKPDIEPTEDQMAKAIERLKATMNASWKESQSQLYQVNCSVSAAMLQEALAQTDRDGTPTSTIMMGKIMYLARQMDRVLSERTALTGSSAPQLRNDEEFKIYLKRYRGLVKSQAPKLPAPEIEKIAGAIAKDASLKSNREVAIQLSVQTVAALYAYKELMDSEGQGIQLDSTCSADFAPLRALLINLRDDAKSVDALKPSMQKRWQGIDRGTIKPTNPAPPSSTVNPAPSDNPMPFPVGKIKEANVEGRK